MIDYSRASISKSSKESFDKAANNIIDYVNDLKKAYEATWTELESLRKERAAIIENVIQVLKSNNIKTPKPLGRCNNEEINEVLGSIVDSLPFYEREEIQLSIVRINNRYSEIVKKGNVLNGLNEELANTRVLEADSKEEVVVSLSQYKELEPKPSESLEMVEKTSKASPELVANMNALLSKKKKDVVEHTIEMPAIIEENDLSITQDEVVIEDEIPPLVEEEIRELYNLGNYLEDELAISEEKEQEIEESDYALHRMKSDQTLAAIADNVYGDEKYWEDLYNYQDNKGKIDRKVAEHKVSVKKAAHTIGILTDLELKFPAELITYEEITEKSMGKSA